MWATVRSSVRAPAAAAVGSGRDADQQARLLAFLGRRA